MVTFEPSSFDVALGQTIQLKVTVQAPSVAGMYLRVIQGSAGEFLTIQGQGTAVSGAGVVHSTPKRVTDGVATFLVNWKAPQVIGAVQFGVSVLAANGDRNRSGDSPDEIYGSVAVGCMEPSRVYHRDFDGDGHGRKTYDQLRDCTKPLYYAETDDDCDDNDERNFPGSIELCDGRDNNCNGVVDDGLGDLVLYEDRDRDGYGRPGGMSRVGCTGLDGWGVGQDDCDDDDATVHPGAQEVCNGKDSDCDGRVDDGVLPDCGTGWCRRLAFSCDGTCVPGEPRAELCNYFDDDCNGLVDDGPNLCPSGQNCIQGACVAGELPPPPMGNAGMSGMVPEPMGPAVAGGGGATGGPQPPQPPQTPASPAPTATSSGGGANRPADEAVAQGCVSRGPTTSNVGAWLTLGLLVVAWRRRSFAGQKR